MKKFTTLAIFAIAALAFSCTDKSAAVADQQIAIINQYTAQLDSVSTLEDYNSANEQFQLAMININKTSADGVTIQTADSLRLAQAIILLEDKMNSVIDKIQNQIQDSMDAAIQDADTTKNTL